MKNLTFLLPTALSLLILPCLPNFSKAQTWLDDDHIWQFEITHTWTPDLDGLYTLEVTGDTVIQGLECKILSHFPKTDGYPEDRYAYEEGEAVFLYEPDDDEFQKIYDFSLGVGDSVGIEYSEKYFIDSVGTVQVDWEDRRFQHVHFGWLPEEFLIIEGIGFVGNPGFTNPNTCSYFFHNSFHCTFGSVEMHNIIFRCFTDGETFLTTFGGECTLTTETEVLNEFPKLYPNPTSGLLHIDAPPENPISELQLFDLRGGRFSTTISQTNQLNVSYLPPGIYFLKMKFRNGETLTEKIVVAK